MKSKKYKRYTLYFFLLIFLILIAAIIVIVVKNKKKTEAASAPQVQTVIASPTPTVDLTQQARDEGMDIPEGITIVEGPVGATASPYSNTTGNNSNSGITIVNNPNVSTSGNSGITIVDNPYQSSGGSSGITIVDNPYQPSGGSGNITIVDGPGTATGTTIASGTISSSSGTGLNTRTYYSAVVTGSNTVTVYVDVSLSHGSLSANGGNVLTVSLGGDSKTINASSINSSGSGETRLGGTSFTVYLSNGQSTSLNLSTSWRFNGNYSGTYISSITSSGSVYLKR